MIMNPMSPSSLVGIGQSQQGSKMPGGQLPTLSEQEKMMLAVGQGLMQGSKGQLQDIGGGYQMRVRDPFGGAMSAGMKVYGDIDAERRAEKKRQKERDERIEDEKKMLEYKEALSKEREKRGWGREDIVWGRGREAAREDAKLQREQKLEDIMRGRGWEVEDLTLGRKHKLEDAMRERGWKLGDLATEKAYEQTLYDRGRRDKREDRSSLWEREDALRAEKLKRIEDHWNRDQRLRLESEIEELDGVYHPDTPIDALNRLAARQRGQVNRATLARKNAMEKADLDSKIASRQALDSYRTSMAAAKEGEAIREATTARQEQEFASAASQALAEAGVARAGATSSDIELAKNMIAGGATVSEVAKHFREKKESGDGAGAMFDDFELSIMGGGSMP
jgi:hypothetical protein